ncbi:flagellar export chaperone FlgN [Pseudochelatococcus sp. B33]
MSGRSEDTVIDGGAAERGQRKSGGARTGGGARRALGQVFTRLEAVLEAERDALQQGRMADLDEITRRKSQCLLDLTRLSRALNVEALAAEEGGEPFLRELAGVKARLADNEAMLRRYVEAAREVASLVADGMRASESDGTYAEAGPFGRYGR